MLLEHFTGILLGGSSVGIYCSIKQALEIADQERIFQITPNEVAAIEQEKERALKEALNNAYWNKLIIGTLLVAALSSVVLVAIVIRRWRAINSTSIGGYQAEKVVAEIKIKPATLERELAEPECAEICSIDSSSDPEATCR